MFAVSHAVKLPFRYCKYYLKPCSLCDNIKCLSLRKNQGKRRRQRLLFFPIWLWKERSCTIKIKSQTKKVNTWRRQQDLLVLWIKRKAGKSNKRTKEISSNQEAMSGKLNHGWTQRDNSSQVLSLEWKSRNDSLYSPWERTSCDIQKRKKERLRRGFNRETWS